MLRASTTNSTTAKALKIIIFKNKCNINRSVGVLIRMVEGLRLFLETETWE